MGVGELRLGTEVSGCRPAVGFFLDGMVSGERRRDTSRQPWKSTARCCVSESMRTTISRRGDSAGRGRSSVSWQGSSARGTGDTCGCLRIPRPSAGVHGSVGHRSGGVGDRGGRLDEGRGGRHGRSREPRVRRTFYHRFRDSPFYRHRKRPHPAWHRPANPIVYPARRMMVRDPENARMRCVPLTGLQGHAPPNTIGGIRQDDHR